MTYFEAFHKQTPLLLVELKSLWFSFLSLNQFLLLTCLWLLFLGQKSEWSHSYLLYSSCSWFLANCGLTQNIPRSPCRYIRPDSLLLFVSSWGKGFMSGKLQTNTKLFWTIPTWLSAMSTIISFGNGKGRGGNCCPRHRHLLWMCVYSKMCGLSAQGKFLPREVSLQEGHAAFHCVSRAATFEGSFLRGDCV